MNFRQVILTLYILLLSGLGIGGLVLFKDVHDEYAQLRQAEAADRRRLVDAQNRLRDQEKVLERLRDDPAFVDRVIRMKLGYAKPDEFIFRFEDSAVKGSVDQFSPPRN